MTDISRRRAVSIIGSAVGGNFVAPRLRLDALDVPISGGEPDDEDFWRRIRSGFDLPKGITHTPHSWISITSSAAIERVVKQGL